MRDLNRLSGRVFLSRHKPKVLLRAAYDQQYQTVNEDRFANCRRSGYGRFHTSESNVFYFACDRLIDSNSEKQNFVWFGYYSRLAQNPTRYYINFILYIYYVRIILSEPFYMWLFSFDCKRRPTDRLNLRNVEPWSFGSLRRTISDTQRDSSSCGFWILCGLQNDAGLDDSFDSIFWGNKKLSYFSNTGARIIKNIEYQS